MLPSWEPNWKRRYNSPPDDIIREFYGPAFGRSVRYDRAVGFFSSRLLASLSARIDDFVLNGGHMRLITSPANLCDKDLIAVGKGENIREHLRTDLISAIQQPIPDRVLLDRLKLITWMVAKGVLEFKIALREHPDSYAIFHEKIGVFADDAGNWMTFSGSPNETIGGMSRNSESFPLHRSWASEDQKAFAEDERQRFEDVWNGKVGGLRTWSATQWIAEPMREHFGIREPMPTFRKARITVPPMADKNTLFEPGDLISLLPRLPKELTLREYQKNAVNDWLREQGRGVFAMATGTGKTITALAAATQASIHAARHDRPLLIVVVVPLVDLVEQWKSDAEWFGFRPAVCHGQISRRQREELKKAFSNARAVSGKRAEMVITTAGSLTPIGNTDENQHFLQRQLGRHTGALLVVGDEMHSLGTKHRLDALPQSPTYTLGLSATPRRHGDDQGTDALLEYFGRPVVSISIKDAIYKLKALVEYDYFPQVIELTPDEAEKYRQLSSRIARAFANADDDAAEKAIRERTRLCQHAQNKLPALHDLMARGLKSEHQQIIYVAEGNNPETDIAQIQEVEDLLKNTFRMRVERYYGLTETSRRETLQRQLADGSIQGLLAMKCLDEGVDIPSARIGIITASTQNPRQFVQRRGRLLRQDPKNPKALSIIHDFIVLPPRSAEVSESEKTLIGAELGRAAELADAARNREVLSEIRDWAYDLGLDPGKFSWMLPERDDLLEVWTDK